MSGSRIDQNI